MSDIIKCPECGKDMEKGVVSASDNSLLNIKTTVNWHPDSQKGKLRFQTLSF